MPRGKPKPRKGKDMLAWRSRQKPGSIMKPSTFEKIKRSAAARGADDPEAVAGAAYWRTVRAKYRKAKKHHSAPNGSFFDTRASKFGVSR